MVLIIPRHPFPTGNAEEGLAVLQENAQELIDGLEAGSANLGDALGTTLTLAEAHCLMDPRAAIFPTWEAWVNAMQVGSALFAAATTSEERVQCRIAHKDRTLQATPVVRAPGVLAHLLLPGGGVPGEGQDHGSVPGPLVPAAGERLTLRGVRLRLDRHPPDLLARWPGPRPKAGGRGRRDRPGDRRGPGDGGQVAVPADGDVPPLHPQGQRRLQPGACHGTRTAQAVLERGGPSLPNPGPRRPCPPSPWPVSPTTRASPSMSSPSTCQPSSLRATGAASTQRKKKSSAAGTVSRAVTRSTTRTEERTADIDGTMALGPVVIWRARPTTRASGRSRVRLHVPLISSATRRFPIPWRARR